MSLEGIRNKLGATQERSVPGGPGAAAVLGGEARALRAALVEKQLQQMPEEERVLNTEQIREPGRRVQLLGLHTCGNKAMQVAVRPRRGRAGSPADRKPPACIVLHRAISVEDMYDMA